jgi:lipopolysaccharide export system protein LptC
MHLPRKWRDRLSAWLPVLCMAFFALATVWLVRSVPSEPQAQPAAAPSHDPDYYMRQFAVRQFDAQGRMSAELFGAEGRHYPDTDKLAVQAPRWRAYDAQGRLITGLSQSARSNREGSEIELFGNARVVRQPLPPASREGKAVDKDDLPLIFNGQYLHAWTQERRVSSDQPVQLARGDDVFTGERFDYDDRTGIASLQGRVRGVMQPQR